MRALTWAVVVVSAAAIIGGCCEQKASHRSTTVPVAMATQGRVITVGEPMVAGSGQIITVSQVMSSPEQYAGKPVQVSGTVDSVCEAKGCWARLKDQNGSGTLFVKFTCPTEEGGRIMPLEAKGRPAVVQGTVNVVEISQEEARHYAMDAGKSPAEIEKIVGPQKQVSVSSPAVRVTME